MAKRKLISFVCIVIHARGAYISPCSYVGCDGKEIIYEEKNRGQRKKKAK